MYMIKLQHIDDVPRPFSWSTNRYPTATGGKAHLRTTFREMEFGPLDLRCVKRTLVKSDFTSLIDINGRLKAMKRLPKGNHPKPGVPESLSSCRIAILSDMRVLDEDDQEVELRDLDEDMDEDVIHGIDLEKLMSKMRLKKLKQLLMLKEMKKIPVAD